MITNKFWTFFKPLAEAIPTVQKVWLSDTDRIDRFVSTARSQDVYPAIFVMRPKWSGQTQNTMEAYLEVKLYVFCHGHLNNETEQDAAFDASEVIIENLIKELVHQGHDYNCFFDFGSVRTNPVAYLNNDSIWGYELDFRIGFMVNDLIC